MNGDPSPLTDQRIPTQRCECSVTLTQTPRCKSSASLTVPAALHSHLSKSHNHTHLIHSLYIPCTPLTLSGLVAIWMKLPPVTVFIRSLDFLDAGFNPSKLPVCCLPHQQVSCLLAFRTTLHRVPCIRLQVYRDFLVRLGAVYVCSVHSHCLPELDSVDCLLLSLCP